MPDEPVGVEGSAKAGMDRRSSVSTQEGLSSAERRATVEHYAKILSFVAILGLLVYIVVSPDRLYSPLARTTIFFLCGAFLAVLAGSEVANRFDFKLGGMALTLVSAAAVAVGTVWILTLLAAPEEVICAFDVRDESGRDVDLTAMTVKVYPRQTAGELAFATKNSTLYVVFPSSVSGARIVISYAVGPQYTVETTRPTSARAAMQFTKEGKIVLKG